MNFTQMHDRLRQELLRRIQRGTLSVSLLSRQTGFGQSHLSNFLHSRRQLSLEAMDRILATQHMAAADLLPANSGIAWQSGESSCEVPLVSHSAALFEPTIRVSSVQKMLQLPDGSLASARARATPGRRSWQRFVAITVPQADTGPMDPLVMPGALLLIDRHYISLAPYRAGRANLYAVEHEGRLKVRYLDLLLNRLVLRPLNIAFPVELIDADSGRSPIRWIAGRIVLVLNEL